jgi:thiamine biosynthesis lipoprotein
MFHENKFESMGTVWTVSVWDDISEEKFAVIKGDILKMCEEFEKRYSRFLKDSLVWKMAESGVGEYEVGEELVEILQICKKLNEETAGKFNPLIGFSLADLGYDDEYSLQVKDRVRGTPDFNEVLRIVGSDRISLTEAVLLDIGALGKGFMVDRIFEMLENLGLAAFLVNGSGDIRYKGDKAIKAGLEDSENDGYVIGTVDIKSGALAASGNNRREWQGISHIVDPSSLIGERNIYAEQVATSWILAEKAVYADALATCALLVDPEILTEKIDVDFEYCVMNRERRIKKSAGFVADFFS